MLLFTLKTDIDKRGVALGPRFVCEERFPPEMAREGGERRAIEMRRATHLVALCAALLGCVGIVALGIPWQGDAVVLDAWLPQGGDGSYEEAMTAGVLAGPTDELRVGSGSGSRGRSGVSTDLARTSSLADEETVKRTSNRQSAREMRQHLARLDNQAKLLRTKAHLVRLEASDDIHAASGELKQAARDESARGRISLSMRQGKAGMKKSAAEEKEDAKEADKKEGVAMKIQAKVASLRSRSAAFVKLAKADRHAAADAKNKADSERKLVSDSMVGVSRDERRVDQVKRSLSKVQARYLSVKARGAARIATAVKAADAEEARAKAAKRAFKALGLHANDSGKKKHK